MKLEDLQHQLLDLQEKYDNLIIDNKSKDELLEGFKSKELEHTKKVSEYQEQIMRLRDMNTELFLKVSQPIPQEPTPIEPTVGEPKTRTLEEIMGLE